ncbi:MAG TPA: type II toxin-antitoxin system RelE/ParE family toxin [Nitrospinae bacterium]|nr:type II toxin-antitoxin system RelE/ParE family toxin [Nitrospinota bacterium]
MQLKVKFTYDFAEIDGRIPMIVFLDSLSIKERAKIFAYIEKLVELKNCGIHPKENLSKHLDDGIFELRVSFENRISRSFYFYELDKQIIFTHGFIKKEQKTPKSEIEKAKTIRKLWRGGK